jgi:DNA-directed RNA polymerase sigma subunit (sigma70/sigma32)
MADELSDRQDFLRFLKGLSDQELKLLRERLGSDFDKVASLEEVSRKFAITRESIARIEKKARKILQDRGFE